MLMRGRQFIEGILRRLDPLSVGSADQILPACLMSGKYRYARVYTMALQRVSPWAHSRRGAGETVDQQYSHVRSGPGFRDQGSIFHHVHP